MLEGVCVCAICGKLAQTNRCRKCGRLVCDAHYSISTSMCTRCSNPLTIEGGRVRTRRRAGGGGLAGGGSILPGPA